MRKWIKEPLAHFLGIGALLFVIHSLVSGPSSPDTDKTIRISPGDIRRLTAAWEMQWRRPPSRDELANLVNEHVREEILYREALAMGLDQDDSIVRRRLAQKMQFLSEDTAASEEPSDTDIEQFFQNNRKQFETPAQATFTHSYFSPDKRGRQARADAEKALAAISAGGAAPPGDRFMLQSHYAKRTPEHVAGLFGSAFAEGLFDLSTGSWQGPLESGYGIHLVRVEEKTEAVAPALEDILSKVRTAWSDDHRRKANDRLYERLREDYEVEIDSALEGVE